MARLTLSLEVTPLQPNAAAQTEKLLHALWERNLPMLRERVLLLERAADTAQAATLTPPLRRDAAMTAHKLAGSLGMFGYMEGTGIARQIETLLDEAAFPDPDHLTLLTAQLRNTLPLEL